VAPPAAWPCCDDGELAGLAADWAAELAGAAELAAEEGEPAELLELGAQPVTMNPVAASPAAAAIAG
jgi:hypothetical protein